jgi:hypothetical protein
MLGEWVDGGRLREEREREGEGGEADHWLCGSLDLSPQYCTYIKCLRTLCQG